jgi:hypothetical protein
MFSKILYAEPLMKRRYRQVDQPVSMPIRGQLPRNTGDRERMRNLRAIKLRNYVWTFLA